MTDPFPKIPLTFRVPTIPLEKSISQPCPECKRSFVIRSANWKKEPFALCLDCGNEFELADTPVTGEKAPWEDLPPELIKTLGIEPPHTPGGLDADALRELQEKGFKLSDPESPDLAIRVDKVIQQVPGMIYRSSKKGDELSVDEILRLAGNPLPADQRRRCPKCDAVIAQDDKRCNWCGQTV
ncbi:MAG TPA: hypothetical protein DEH22_07255 [Chloroflexi bacterium]|nr:hypothetical protein [Chloroflexota bacterium]